MIMIMIMNSNTNNVGGRRRKVKILTSKQQKLAPVQSLCQK
eukprot:09924.XXX_8943_9078_1 [CDS] Oithona nana genome sequencing.